MENESEISEKKLKPFYVYELLDSSTKKVFYIGKGTGERALQHKKQANNTDKSNNKLNKIREIESSGSKIIELIIGRYTTEKEAFAVESTLIHWVYGYDNLKNDVGGHGCDSIRPFRYLETIEGIDIPEKKSSFDGSDTKNGIALREKNNIISFMESIKLYFEKNTDYILSEIDIKKPYSTKFYYHISGVNVTILTRNSPKKLLWVEVQALDGKLKNREKIKNLCNSSDLEVKNNGAYATFPNFKKTPSKKEILIDFNRMLENIKS